MTQSKTPPDQADRKQAIVERSRNVVIDAGAGTGKTTILVKRLVQLVAPADDTLPALEIARIAAVTFTRKAAGELKLRLREALLEELAGDGLSTNRRARLSAALQGLDTAHIGTIHSFADRLLRLRPREAQLSPSYEICEDTSTLESETYDVLLQAAELGTLPERLAGRLDAERCKEVAETITGGIRAGLKPDDRTFPWGSVAGLRGLFSSFIGSRDHLPKEPELERLDLKTFRRLAREFIQLAKSVDGSRAIGTWFRKSAKVLEAVLEDSDPFEVLAAVNHCLRSAPERPRKKDESDEDTWRAWKAWDNPFKGQRDAPLREDLVAPVMRWICFRLVRTQPAVIGIYEAVKAAHRQLDQIDLLLKLRDLLRDDKAVRADYQALFDHVLVDEFQDTDPLQAEIILFLCEAGAVASRWKKVELAPGKLTIVGDPKQSIYRFRRADIAMYDAVRTIVMKGPHLATRLVTNFRSRPRLLAWLNERFDACLGAAKPGKPVFNPQTGEVHNEALEHSRDDDGAPSVRVVPFDCGKANRDAYRDLEAFSTARYLRWLVDVDRPSVLDPVRREPRPVRFGDIAVLAVSTFNLDKLFAEFDVLGIPYASRGGRLFLQDPLHRQFLLGLRAIADRDDGISEAALLRPPFFSIDLADLGCELAARRQPDAKPGARDAEAIDRARDAKALVTELRHRRFERGPGETARDLLERTAFARTAALGPNGAQRVERLRELCLALERVAAEDGLDFDSATAITRGWIDEPVQLDPPPPLDSQAVQVLTIHQAKGLEFPVVALWDGSTDFRVRSSPTSWRLDRDGRSWWLRIDGAEWEEPQGNELAETEKEFRLAELRRLMYVAATRARDFLLVPQAGDEPPDRRRSKLWGFLTANEDPELVQRHPFFDNPELPPEWVKVDPPPPTATPDASARERDTAIAWSKASTEAAKPRFAPSSVTALAHTPEKGEEERPLPFRKSRFGRLFGDTVHHAIGLVLRQPTLAVAEAVYRAAREFELEENLPEAEADVNRALQTLAALGLRRAPGPDLKLEYPLAKAKDGLMVVGYIDLVSLSPTELVVIDFKTDAPPAPDAGVPEAYATQVRSYGTLLDQAGIRRNRAVKTGLLFTADGSVRWVA
jgi:ATP-dependent helicase/nuclease subunit A